MAGAALLLALTAAGASDPAAPALVPAPAPAVAIDTTFQVPEGTRIVIEHDDGDIVITGVAGREARFLLDAEPRGLSARRDGDAITVRTARRRRDGDIAAWLPSDADIVVRCREGTVVIEGMEGGGVQVSAADGDVSIDGAASATVATLDGDVRIAGVTGPASVSVADGDVWLERATGPVTASAVDGDIVVTGSEARAASLTTVDGDVWYDGAVHPDGTYSLSAHDGDMTFVLPEGAGANISVSTFDGDFLPSFPVQFDGGRLRGSAFTIGGGGARIDLKSFDGDINLIRPGERRPEREENQ